MNKQRFRNFDLLSIRFPFTAIISFLHRVSGIFVFLLIPFLLWMLDVASGSQAGFDRMHDMLANPVSKITLWLLLVALWYHLLAGVRHLIMDMGHGETLRSARISGALCMVVTAIAAVFIGIWLW
jgi:succinate dehydrogenase / fumarate reductase cytochrome b subunit